MPDLDQIAVLIPTLGRPDKLPALVENIHETTTVPHTVYLIVELDDQPTLDAIKPLDTFDVIGAFGSPARAVNAGYHATTETFFAVGNDDCRFHPDWDTRALGRMSDTTHIVGLNDGTGDCKCFTLARRSYIQERSGVFDQPDTVYHEYLNQCCDTEFAHYAQLRGVWADADDAVVEHVHWRHGKADPSEPNYVRARENNPRDLETYNQRRDLWDPGHVTPDCSPVAA